MMKKKLAYGLLFALVCLASCSFTERREPIDRAARSLTAVCRQQLPAAKPAADGPPRPQGGLNLIGPNQN